MENKTFNRLIEKVQFEMGNGIESFGFSAKVKNSELSFYVNGCASVIVEDFGAMKGGKWNQEEPTPEQIEVMQNIINKKIEDWGEEEEEEEEVRRFNGDYYDYYGVKIEMFY